MSELGGGCLDQESLPNSVVEFGREASSSRLLTYRVSDHLPHLHLSNATQVRERGISLLIHSVAYSSLYRINFTRDAFPQLLDAGNGFLHRLLTLFHSRGERSNHQLIDTLFFFVYPTSFIILILQHFWRQLGHYRNIDGHCGLPHVERVF